MGDPGTDLRAVLWRRMDPEKPAQPAHTLLHAHQAEASPANIQILKVESLAVIAHRQADPFGRADQPDGHVGRLGMFGHVLQTLLQHTEQIRGNFLRERPWYLTSVVRHRKPSPFR